MKSLKELRRKYTIGKLIKKIDDRYGFQALVRKFYVHWFNPFAYLVSANISEACEVSCDMSVIKDLDEQEQRLYMNTILDLVQAGKRRERNV